MASMMLDRTGTATLRMVSVIEGGIKSYLERDIYSMNAMWVTWMRPLSTLLVLYQEQIKWEPIIENELGHLYADRLGEAIQLSSPYLFSVVDYGVREPPGHFGADVINIWLCGNITPSII